MSSIPVLAVSAIILLGIFWVFKKIVGLNVPPFWGVLFIYLGGFIFSLIAYLIVRPEFKFDITFKRGMALAIGSGAFIAAFDLLNLFIFKKGMGVASAAPLLMGGAVMVSSIAGILFLKESINLIHFLGILTVIGGIFLLTR